MGEEKGDIWPVGVCLGVGVGTATMGQSSGALEARGACNPPLGMCRVAPGLVPVPSLDKKGSNVWSTKVGWKAEESTIIPQCCLFLMLFQHIMELGGGGKPWRSKDLAIPKLGKGVVGLEKRGASQGGRDYLLPQ